MSVQHLFRHETRMLHAWPRADSETNLTRQCCKVFIELNFLQHVEVSETPGYICNRLPSTSVAEQLLKKCRVASISKESRRCSRYFKPRSKVFGKHLKFFLSSMLVRLAGRLASTTNTSRFCLSVFKNNFLLSTSKTRLLIKYMLLWRPN